MNIKYVYFGAQTSSLTERLKATEDLKFVNRKSEKARHKYAKNKRCDRRFLDELAEQY